jgi:hypothetical protein
MKANRFEVTKSKHSQKLIVDLKRAAGNSTYKYFRMYKLPNLFSI